MNRKKFIENVSFGVAGMSLVSACSGKGNDSATEKTSLLKEKIPDYRTKIKSSFAMTNTGSAGDKVILALVGAGSWGTYLVQNIIDLNNNIEFKYVCDVDDTRGGAVIADIEKKQGFPPARVRDMRKVFDDKDVDGVIIATPQHWHGLASIWAMQAGKDVYVE